MSNLIMNLCRPARMPPTPKNVLMALADRADDTGLAWPSLAGLSDATCFSRTAVIGALKWLEGNGVLIVSKDIGKNSRYTIIRERIEALTPAKPVREPHRHPSDRHTGADGTPVREADGTRQAAAPPPVREANVPVREAYPNHQEPPVQPSLNHQKGRAHSAALALSRPDDVGEQVWADWHELRKAKKAPVTETVVKEARREAAKADMPLDAFLRIWCARGSQGLQAEWLKPQERAAARRTAGTFADVDYTAGVPR